ncbi:hypothetical protein H0A43_07410 [Arcobacter lanthieri]|uniref:hypothetical protein n=1 Tax=Aliarcobacter lanthieri TaxID=1355374 RepID=UPI00192184AF|nr:hypothetical protein [Aliarcobacter lanthieri]MBL3520299.1 hypothetical protein [Aliarcobacter lanthieri]
MTKEELEALTVEQLKAECKKAGKKGYSELKREELISLLLDEEDKKEELEDVEDEIFTLNALRTCKTETRGEVLGKFEISKTDFEKDKKIQRFIEIGFIIKV